MRNTETLKDRIIKRINKLPNDKLDSVDEFLKSLESNEFADVLSFAGTWKDLNDEKIQELTKGLRKRRSLDQNRAK